MRDTGELRVPWKVIVLYFAIVGFLFCLDGAVLLLGSQHVKSKLVVRQSDTIGVTDLLFSTRSGVLSEGGIVMLVLVGPAADTFYVPRLALPLGALLLVTAFALLRRSRIGALVAAIWSAAVLLLSTLTLLQISSSYTPSARLVMFAPSSLFAVLLLRILFPEILCAQTAIDHD